MYKLKEPKVNRPTPQKLLKEAFEQGEKETRWKHEPPKNEEN
jgi:hypothetical protein